MTNTREMRPSPRLIQEPSDSAIELILDKIDGDGELLSGHLRETKMVGFVALEI